MAAKSERLLNLYIMLRARRRFCPKADIRRALYPDYADTPRGDEAFEKAFERDKDDLRELGVVIEVGSTDTYFEDEVGYRITEQASSLPEIRFEPDEAAVLGLAARVWEHATVARDATSALQKLARGGVALAPQQGEPGALDVIAPTIRAEEPSFDAFWDAVQRRQPVRFDHRSGGAGTPARRHLQPWGVVRFSGRWYVVGHDVDRGEPRVFRLSRVEGAVKAAGPVAAYDVPEGTDVRAIAASLAPRPRPVRATLLVREGAGIMLRRRAIEITATADGPDERTGWDLVVVEGDVDDLADAVLVHVDRVVVESPPELREAVVGRLAGVVEAAAS